MIGNWLNIQPEIVFHSTGIKIVFFSLFISAVLISNAAFSQCPEKEEFIVLIQSNGSSNSISIENNSALSDIDYILLEVDRGEIDLVSEGIRVNSVGDKLEFRNLKIGEYIIKITSNECRLYLSADKMGKGYVIE